MADVNTPVGKVKKEYLLIGGGVVVILGYGMYRSKKNASAAAAVASAGANTGIDPATGYAYGSAEDAAALGNQNSYINPGQPYYSGSGGSNYVGNTGNTFSTNAQWAQAAETYMQSLGGDPTAIGNALGKYIAGGQVTSDMQALIEQAIAFEGYPPVAGPNGYPPSINIVAGGTTTIPGPIDKVNLISWTAQTAYFEWTPSAGATSYVVSNPNGTTREVPSPYAYVGGAVGGNITHFPFTFSVQGKNSAGLGPVATAVVTGPGGTR